MSKKSMTNEQIAIGKMPKDKTNIWKLRGIDLGFAAMITFCLLLAMSAFFAIPIEPLFIVTRLILFAPVIILLHIRVFRLVVWGVGILLAVLVGVSFALSLDNFFVNFISDYAQWLYEFIAVQIRYDRAYIDFTYGALLLAFFVAAYVCMRIHLYIPIFVAGAMLFLSQPVDEFSLPLFVLFLLLLVVVMAWQVVSKHNRTGLSTLFGGIIPLCVIALLLSVVTPKSPSPLQIPAVSDIVDALNLDVRNWAMFRPTFGAGNLGGGQLGGPFRGSDTVMVSVTNGYQTYLRAYTFLHYDGSRWHSVGIDDDRTARSYTEIFDQVLFEDGRTRQMTIEYQALQTNLLLRPQFMVRYSGPAEVTVFEDPARDVIYVDTVQGQGFEYTVTAFYPRIDREDYYAILRMPQGVARITDNMTSEERTIAEEIAAAEREAVREAGTLFFAHGELLQNRLVPRWTPAEARELPGALHYRQGHRVAVLAREITAPYNNQFDRAMALERYLRENFEYYTEMRHPPRNVDFVDHFLFEEQRGHCQYFASAFVVMARTLGMPARYVQGFVLRPVEDGEEGEYEATGWDAHAWGEVFFEGLGWVIFEPTPGFADAAPPPIAPPLPPSPPPGEQTPTPTPPPPTPTPPPGYTPTPPDRPDITPPPRPGDPDYPGDTGGIEIPPWVWIVSGIVTAKAAMLLFNNRRSARKARRIADGGADGVKLLWKTVLKIMPLYGLGKHDDETVREYAARLSSELSLPELRSYAAQLDALVYGNVPPQDAPYGEFYDAWRDSLRCLSWWRYAILRFGAGVI
ncbi:MAG: DUF3488 and transglutaminase-like domain-containing protein [Oscillospiraceae bacterium]|nr:DUF3488 and transglutaminase-like domain-containing protein [Oscillospiraceae bacterium]